MLTNPQTIFNALAEQYDAYRPHYPPEALLFLVTLAELDRTSDVADIGSGTGRIALELAKYVRLVYAVDTAAAMLQQLSSRAAEQGLSNIRMVEAPAEDTGLVKESLAMAVLAQSFHWLDKEATLREMRRIIEPGKLLVVMWNQTTNIEDEYYRKIVALIKSYNPTYRGGSDIISVDFQPAIEASGYFSPTEKYSFPFELQYRMENYIGFLLSKSYIGVGIAQERLPQFMEEVHSILNEYFPNGKIVEQYESIILVSRRND